MSIIEKVCGVYMQIISKEKVLCPTKELDKNGKPKFAFIGYRLHFDNNVTVFYTRRTRTISVTYAPTKKYYRSGDVVTDSVGRVQWNEPVKIGAIKLSEARKHFSENFVNFIIESLI